MYRNFRRPTRSRGRSNIRADSVKSVYDSDSDTGSDQYPFKTIFVNNIDPEISEEKLKKFFGTFGRVFKPEIKHQNERQSYAFVKFDHPEYARDALKNAQYSKVGRYEIIVMTPANRKRLRPEGKIFIKGFSEETKTKELHEFFEKVSKNMYVRFTTDEDGTHLNICCVHFFDPRDAERALKELQGKEFQGNKLELQRWLPRGQREKKPQEQQQNLFVSGLRNLSNQELTKHYIPIFKRFGEIQSVVFNEKNRTALLMYTYSEDAHNAFEKLIKQEDCGDLKVHWHQSLAERAKEVSETKNRLYLDGLHFQVSKEILEGKFGQYGRIISSNMNPSKTRQKNLKTQYAVIAYDTEEEAEKALAKASKSQEISDLFISLQYKKIQYFEEKPKDFGTQKNHYENHNYNHYPKTPFQKPFKSKKKKYKPAYSQMSQNVVFVPTFIYGVPMQSPEGFVPMFDLPLQNSFKNQNHKPPKPFYPEESKVSFSKYQPKAIVEEQENLDRSSFYSNSMEVSGLDTSKMSGIHNDTYSFEMKEQSDFLKESLMLSKKTKKVVWNKNVPNNFK